MLGEYSARRILELETEKTTLSQHIGRLASENAELDREASLNPVSRFYNERGLKRHFEEMVAEKPHTRLAVIAVDLSSFNAVNNKLGHHEGDKLLRSVGKLFRMSDVEATVYNPHGDEFIVVTPLEPRGDRQSQEMTDDERIAAIIERLKGAGAALTLADERLARLNFGISAGGVVHRPGADLHETLLAADEAMYRDKQENLPELNAEQAVAIQQLIDAHAALEALGIPKRMADKYLDR